MANYKVVDAEQLDADLKTVADAIREKGGTTESLEFPLGMKSAVENIKSGGGLTIEGVVTGVEPAGDVVLGAITPKQQALIRCTNITSLTLNGTNLASGNTQPFSYLGGMEKLTLKNTTGSTSALAFAYASTCREVKIIGTYATLSSNCFNGFGANLRNGEPSIYVPWAEGEVAGAPWGATKATIYYNTVYDESDNPIV